VPTTKKNIILATTQSLLNALTLFAVYKYILTIEDIETLGLWSLVIAVSSFARLSEIGMSGTTTRFIAKYRALNNKEAVVNVIRTTSTIVVPLVLGTTAALYFPAKLVLDNILSGNHLDIANQLLPYSLLTAAFATSANLYLFSLDGMQRVDLRAKTSIVCLLIYLVLVLLLTPLHGIHGVVYAQLAQSIALLLISLASLKQIIPDLPLKLFGWNKNIFNEIIGYGLKLQFTTLTIFLYEPLTKILFGMYGDLSSLAKFDIANKCVSQVRALGIAANRAVVPKFAELAETNASSLRRVFEINNKIAINSSLIIFSLIAVFSTIVSHIFLDGVDREFIVILLICCLTWFLNSISQAAYFTNLGSGHINGNLAGHVVTMIFNLIFGFSLGALIGFKGVLFAWSASLIMGSLTVFYMYLKRHNFTSRSLFSNKQLTGLLINMVGLLMSFYYMDWMSNKSYSVYNVGISLLVFSCFCTVSIYIFYKDIKSLSQNAITGSA